ncbi:sugar transporter [Lactobacillus equicursoris]|uniref:Sugar transporter n=1 Tax=Lactobacillus equicursoris TaxID=420645 RepID=A0A844FLR5_9LACO|nr:GRP family sugar transporter [Lactobacillus equicursoris]MST79279.1 sugar transporter [Lactobacillus equicursoris]
MNIIIALLPAIGWGIMPWIVNKVPASKPSNQILGVGLGATLVGIIVTIAKQPATSLPVFLISLLSGAFWTIGQIGQFISFTKIGVSKTMPISTGLQLVGNTLIGALIFSEWHSQNDFLFGSIALLVIIVGVILTAYTEKDADESKKATKKDFLFLILTTVGYLVYSAFPKTISANAESMFLPQTLGILLGAIIYLLFSKQQVAFKQKASYLDIFAGIAFGIAAYTYIISAQLNGVTNAFIYGQLSVIISTLGGMTLLGEKQEGKELLTTLAGLALIVVGAVL